MRNMPLVSKKEPAIVVSEPLSHLDVAVIVDTTGSMLPFNNASREHMVAILRRLTDDANTLIDLHVAIVEYRDHPPQDMSFVTREYAFTKDLVAVQRTIAKLTPDG